MEKDEIEKLKEVYGAIRDNRRVLQSTFVAGMLGPNPVPGKGEAEQFGFTDEYIAEFRKEDSAEREDYGRMTIFAGCFSTDPHQSMPPRDHFDILADMMILAQVGVLDYESAGDDLCRWRVNPEFEKITPENPVERGFLFDRIVAHDAGKLGRDEEMKKIDDFVSKNVTDRLEIEKSIDENMYATGRNTSAHTGYSVQNCTMTFNAKNGVSNSDLKQGLVEMIDSVFGCDNYEMITDPKPSFSQDAQVSVFEGKLEGIDPVEAQIYTRIIADDGEEREYALNLSVMFPIPLSKGQEDFTEKGNLLRDKSSSVMTSYAKKFADSTSLSEEKAIEINDKCFATTLSGRIYHHQQ